ncbi:MAG: hypothetical protein KBS41_02850 [Oscillospiraceae bacterium]|nr:hypothetical protein [Candidatus Equicaccousia limihippi]
MFKKVLTSILVLTVLLCTFAGCSFVQGEYILPDTYAAVITLKASQDTSEMLYLDNESAVIALARNDNGKDLKSIQDVDNGNIDTTVNEFLGSCLQKNLFEEGGKIVIECSRTNNCGLDIEKVGGNVKAVVDTFIKDNAVNCTSELLFTDLAEYIKTDSSSEIASSSDIASIPVVSRDPNAPKCEKCNGNGYYDCTTCKGHGKLVCSLCSGTGYSPVGCSYCGGNGKCRDCSGTGKIITHKKDSKETVEITCTTCRGACKCLQCEGVGRVKCRVCNATDDKSMLGYEYCTYCHGSKTVKCKVCGGSGIKQGY